MKSAMSVKISLYERADANLAELAKAFPKQFSDPGAYYGWPDSRHHLVDCVCRTAHERNLTVVWRQIKEKFGGLRMYRAGAGPRIDMVHPKGDHSSIKRVSDDPVDVLIAKAEQESLRTCMYCAAEGSERVVDRYVLTLCDEHHAQYVRDHDRDGQ